MKKCSVCRNQITTKDPAILFVGQNGDEKEICTECEKQMDTIMIAKDFTITESGWARLVIYIENHTNSIFSILMKDSAFDGQMIGGWQNGNG